MIYRFRPAILSGLIALGALGGGAVARGDSPLPEGEGSLGYWIERARLAESRVQALESEVTWLRARLLSKSGCVTGGGNASAAAFKRTARSEAPAAGPTTPATPACDPPYFIKDGIKVYRDCVPQADTADACSPPYRFDAEGVKNFLPECLD